MFFLKKLKLSETNEKYTVTKFKTIQNYQLVKYKKQQERLISFPDRGNQYRKHHLSDELIERANKPKNATSRTLVISKTTQAIVAIARQKLCKTRTDWFMSDSYMAKVTKCGTRQNRNIIGQINGTKFDITRCRKRKGWILKTLEMKNIKRKNISELKDIVALDVQSIDEGSYKNNNSKRIRSSKSKFLNSNSRKKVTSLEQKLRYQKFKTYDKTKNLSEHYPLNQEDCYKLQKRCGKSYSLNAMNEILLAISRKPRESTHRFKSKALFMSYMTKVYQNEGRDLNVVNDPTFKIIAGRPQAEITEIITFNQRNSYLKKEEDSAIFNRNDYTQFRARIAGQFPVNLGYDLLSNMISVQKKNSIFEITMEKKIELTEHYTQLLINHAKGIGSYTGVDELEFKEFFH